MATARGGRKGHELPQGSIRQSQIVTTFGPGAMVDLLHDAVLIGGLDLWLMGSVGKGGGGEVIQEPRLRMRVAQALGAGESEPEAVELSHDRPFRAPPAGDDNAPTRGLGIKAFEFPRWFVCQNCRALVRRDQLELKSHSYRHSCVGRSNGTATPVRFVSACRRGHLEDFPWSFFVHKDRPICSHPQLFLDESSSGDFSDVIVRCETCDARRPLSEARADAAMPKCRGERPWLGVDAGEQCEEQQHLMVRTASNSYFPQIMSALTIPDREDPLRAKVEAVFELLETVERPDLPQLRRILSRKLASLSEATDDEIWASLQAIKGKPQVTNLRLRTPEFERFMSEGYEVPGQVPEEDDEFFARRAKLASVPKGLDRVVLAPKLREVRALIGFTRLESATADLQGEYDLGVSLARVGRNVSWLPATEVRGEGLLVVLAEQALASWETLAVVQAREQELRAGYERWARSQDRPPKFPGVRFYMLHTLSHMLMTALSLDCGYAASAIRERIYCSEPGEATKMAGILLSTGTSGSEGTLGGLVEQGRRIATHLKYAWDLARLCSCDPVCAHHSPDGDIAEQYLSGAACYGCLYVAECSCERYNKYLDRALVVPVIGQDAKLAFFAERPA
ncbi:MAG: DrmB family protein [Nannocystaceae bacterium]